MTVELLIVYFLYPIVGLCTIAVLDKYKMRLAKIDKAYFDEVQFILQAATDEIIDRRLEKERKRIAEKQQKLTRRRNEQSKTKDR